jgi:hypothetical protein
VRENLFGEGEADAATSAACREHLEACPACAAERELLGHLAGALRPGEAFPRESEVDWEGFARDTVRRALLEDRPAPAPARWDERLRQMISRVLAPSDGPGWAPARVAWGAAAAVVVAAGVTLMMLSPGPLDPGGPVPGDAQGGQAAAVVPIAMSEGNIDNLTVTLARQNTARYLNETRAVLVTLLDVGIDCDKDKVDVSAERAKATELLRRQRLIAAELNRVPLARAQDVCNELERLLVEISTLADCARDEELQTLRDVVEKRQILVRMELLSAELARREASRA